MKYAYVGVAMLVVVCCATSARVEAETKNGYDYSFEALEKIHEYHYRGKELNDAELLDGGLEGVRALLRNYGVDWKVAGIHHTNTQRSARMQFVAKMEDAVTRGTTVGITKEIIAVVAAKAMTRAARSSHTVFFSEEEALESARRNNPPNHSWVEFKVLERRGKRILYGRLLDFKIADRSIAGTMCAQANIERPDGIVIDLRENRGGSGDRLVELVSVFVDEETEILFAECPVRAERKQLMASRAWRAGETVVTVPLRILIGKQTFCAAEIFAYAMQKLRRARVIGAETSGSVEGLESIRLQSGPGMCIAITKVWTMGDVLEGRGVKPDLLVPMRAEDGIQGRDSQLEAALDELAR